MYIQSPMYEDMSPSSPVGRAGWLRRAGRLVVMFVFNCIVLTDK